MENSIVLKKAMWPKFFPISKTNSIKIPTSTFVEMSKLILRHMWKLKESRIAKTVFEKNIDGLSTSFYSFYFIAILTIKL